MNYADIRLLHISCAAISISLFLLRGAMQFSGIDWRQWRWLRIVPHVNDTLLLGAAVALSLYSHQYPLAQGWLTAKVLALLLYVGLGSIAFRAGRPRAQQAVAFVAALLTVAYIVSVAINRSPTAGLG
ncbi:MAG: SirB2 family protein [Rhodoferax sp.]|nr:SirB2 family protein [Rhodoferax sp.]HQZ07445.1 SirB2 family protein [Burkholderiaceae bacterium]